MDGVGGYAGWRWIFILEGLATICLALLAAAVLPESLASAKFLSEEEKEFACTFVVPFERPSVTHVNCVSQCHKCVLTGSNQENHGIHLRFL